LQRFAKALRFSVSALSDKMRNHRITRTFKSSKLFCGALAENPPLQSLRVRGCVRVSSSTYKSHVSCKTLCLKVLVSVADALVVLCVVFYLRESVSLWTRRTIHTARTRLTRREFATPSRLVWFAVHYHVAEFETVPNQMSKYV
jgi:hypothetical protein